MPLDLRGLRALTPDAAEALAREAVALNLDGLATLEPGVAGKLAEFHGPLSVAGLAEIGPAVAESLVRCRDWDGRLPQLESLSPPIAAKPALDVLRRKPDIRLPPPEWLEVVPGGVP